MDMSHKKDNHFLGGYGERLALAYVKNQGMRVVAVNYTFHEHRSSSKGTPVHRCNSGQMKNSGSIFGELDIVAIDGACLVFIELKWRGSNRFGSSLEAVTPTKQRKLRRLGEAYIALEKPSQKQFRFDVIGISGTAPYMKLQHVRNAF